MNTTGSSVREETLTLLHKTTSLVPRILEDAREKEELLAPLNAVYDELSNQTDPAEGAKLRIAFNYCGLESGMENIVSTLLENPLEPFDAAFRNRWGRNGHDSGGILRLRHAHSFKLSEGENPVMDLPSPWLESNRAAEVLEITKGGPRPLAFLTAHVPVIVGNALTTPLSVLTDDLPWSPNAVLVVTGVQVADADAKRYLENEVVQHYPHLKGRVLFVNSALAIHAAVAVRANPTLPSSIQRYQDYWNASGMPALCDLLLTTLSSQSPANMQMSVYHTAIGTALIGCRSFLEQSQGELEAAVEGLGELERHIKERSEAVRHEITAHESVRGLQEKAVRVTAESKEKMSFWSLPLIADDVFNIASSVLYRSWSKELQEEMTFQAGRLAALQLSINNGTMNFVKTISNVFPSVAVLENTLEQVAASPNNAITAETLLTPIHAQLRKLSHSKAALQSTAQRSLFSFVGTSFVSFTGAGSAYAGFFGPWVEISGATALGSAVLGSLLGLRWAMRMWERAKARAHDDWQRAGSVMERDVKSTVEKTIYEKVIAVPNAAQTMIEETITAQLAAKASLQAEVDERLLELERIQGKQATGA